MYIETCRELISVYRGIRLVRGSENQWKVQYEGFTAFIVHIVVFGFVFMWFILQRCQYPYWSRGSSVGIVTAYGLDD
jgi:hypothetical protein